MFSPRVIVSFVMVNLIDTGFIFSPIKNDSIGLKINPDVHSLSLNLSVPIVYRVHTALTSTVVKNIFGPGWWSVYQFITDGTNHWKVRSIFILLRAAS